MQQLLENMAFQELKNHLPERDIPSAFEQVFYWHKTVLQIPGLNRAKHYSSTDEAVYWLPAVMASYGFHQ